MLQTAVQTTQSANSLWYTNWTLKFILFTVHHGWRKGVTGWLTSFIKNISDKITAAVVKYLILRAFLGKSKIRNLTFICVIIWAFDKLDNSVDRGYFLSDIGSFENCCSKRLFATYLFLGHLALGWRMFRSKFLAMTNFLSIIKGAIRWCHAVYTWYQT